MKATVGGTGRRGKEKDKSWGGGLFAILFLGFLLGGKGETKVGRFGVFCSEREKEKRNGGGFGGRLKDLRA